jgi:CheY-like chemotaxis protein
LETVGINLRSVPTHRSPLVAAEGNDMSKMVLDVGNCRADHASIRRLIEDNFQATVVQAHGLDDALAELGSKDYDLVLINRKPTRGDRDGVAIIRTLKAGEETSDVPVMLLTDYPEHQQAAVELGAEPGFGKAELGAPATLEKLRRFLA